MKTQQLAKLALTLTLLTSANAFADGFVCETDVRDLNVKIFNQTRPSEGTRSAATMILSDPTVSVGRKTIATFSSDTDLLSSEELVYAAKVDLRHSGTSRAGEYLVGTRLGEVAMIYVNVFGFSYNRPVRDGETLGAVLTVEKRNGDRIYRNLNCSRYLKNN